MAAHDVHDVRQVKLQRVFGLVSRGIHLTELPCMGRGGGGKLFRVAFSRGAVLAMKLSKLACHSPRATGQRKLAGRCRAGAAPAE